MSVSGWLLKFTIGSFATVGFLLVGKVPEPYWLKSLLRESLDRTMYGNSDDEIFEMIRWYQKSGKCRRVGDLCHLLGLATRCNACVACFYA